MLVGQMLGGMREFFSSKTGNFVAVGLMLVAVWVVVSTVRSNFGASEAAAASNEQMAVCSETGKSFSVSLQPGMVFPIKSPYSGRETGHLADELCQWTADGKVSRSPTYVLLNSTVGKPGPTFCPTCRRLVVRENPPAEEGKLPPTEQEWLAKQSAASEKD